MKMFGTHREYMERSTQLPMTLQLSEHIPKQILCYALPWVCVFFFIQFANALSIHPSFE